MLNAILTKMKEHKSERDFLDSLSSEEKKHLAMIRKNALEEMERIYQSPFWNLNEQECLAEAQ